MVRALKSRTSRRLGVKEFQLTTTHYLDLPSLERWLSEWRDALLSEAGTRGRALLPQHCLQVHNQV